MTSIEALIDRQLTRRQVFERTPRVQKPAPKGALPLLRVITVSRESGSGGRTLAARVAKSLDFEFIDRQIVDKLCEDTGAHERLISSLDERTRSAVGLWVDGILTGRYIDRSEYAHALCRSVTALAEHGDSVILGRGANVILGPRGGLHIRVIAPPDVRVQNLMQHLGMASGEAQEHIEQCDAERRRFSTEFFDADIDDPNGYDLVINTARISLDMAEALVQLAWDRYLKG